MVVNGDFTVLLSDYIHQRKQCLICSGLSIVFLLERTLPAPGTVRSRGTEGRNVVVTSEVRTVTHKACRSLRVKNKNTGYEKQNENE